MYVADWLLRELEAELAVHPPERGGALLGPRQRPVLTHLVPDPGAVATAISYAPSRALAARVVELEREADLELAGIVHSHRDGLDRPSEQDALELAEGLRRNPHLARYAGPIVSDRREDAELAPHELPLPSGKISFFAAHRTREGGAELRPVRVRLVPLLRDLERAADALGGERPATFVSDAGRGALLAGRLGLPGDLELVVLASELYPSLPPAVLLSGAGDATEQLQLPWALAAPEEDRLVAALRTVFEGRGPYRRAHGPRGGPALTRDEAVARLAGWAPRLTGEDLEARAGARRAAILSRGAGLLSSALRGRSALVAGCGSVGCYVAEHLVRGGVGRLALLDPEAVEAENLSRTVYTAEDVGTPKTAALARRLLGVDPAVELALTPSAVEALEPAALDALVRGADLVVAATDDPGAQRALDRFAYARGKPALFVGLYAGARGGEVVVSVPERTACYLCATRSRHEVERAGGRVAREVDYGTGRLRGEIALAADIQHVASAAVKLALSLLLPPGSEAALGAFAEEVLSSGMSYLTLSTVAGYWFYPRVFGDTPGQGPYQGVWLTPRRSADCPVCGPPAARRDPLTVPLRPPRRAAFAEVLDAERSGR
ncbi:ThiF family adenylyltransferase [Anaeromyxobacter oryzisoli]|uniref:ThiF family adenylyltransferase n=1 Tax=Anaeromyxobacter oryzisoli TaxID=2925408 RepID=UPI001F5AAFCC|nr:ThiF family adenylyltransferase [Anaeromyxobacter sp. SG63]